MKISILTLFPQMFQGPFEFSIIKRAQEKKLVQIEIIDIRDFGIGKHKTVDDKPYGGGHGMILRADVLKRAIESVADNKLSKENQLIILTSASGKVFSQAKALNYSKLKHLIIVCGHYEGVDERTKNYIDEEISIGEYILTGGEIPAMVITDSVSRLIKDVLKAGVVEEESFSVPDTLEHEQYTRPRVVGKYTVPKILLSGNHKNISEWKKEKSLSKSFGKKLK